jgi:hypothetical protein
LESAPGQPVDPTAISGDAPVPEGATAGGPQLTAEVHYVGTNQCFTCHRPQTNTWSETGHVHAFTHLPQQYQNDAACLKCHATGFGNASGYAAGSEKDLAMVGCEACHGPGAAHIEAAQRFILAEPGEEEKIEKQIRETIRKTPADAVCVACHIVQAHQHHPQYAGQPDADSGSGDAVQCAPAFPAAARPAVVTSPAISSSKYSVKTCGGCHYDQYGEWRTGAHADLAKMLPTQHLDNEECQQCHARAGAVAKVTRDVVEEPANLIGVGCESCHGPALAHVQFTKRFINSPPLGPKTEQAARNAITVGKPATTCIRCHLQERHSEHPEFEKG